MPATKKPAPKKAPAARAASKPAPKAAAKQPADGDGRAARALQQAIDELERVRDQSGDDVRRQIDSAVKRIRDFATDVRGRTDERTATVQGAVNRVADEAWMQLGILAIRGLREDAALTELSGEIRKRKTELRAAKKKATA